jgi:hypothetical protein
MQLFRARKGMHATKWPPSAQEARPAGPGMTITGYIAEPLCHTLQDETGVNL